MSQGRQYGKVFTPIKGAGVPLVVAGGDAEATQSYHSLDDSAVLVDLQTLAGMEIGDEVTLVLAVGGFGAVINCNAGGSNITCDFNLNVRLTGITDYVVLKRTSATNWSMVAMSIAQEIQQPLTINAGGMNSIVRVIALMPEAPGPGDTLDTMAGGTEGKQVRLTANNGPTNPIQITHNAGANGFFCPNGLDLSLRSPNDWVDVTYTNGVWVVTGYHVSWAQNETDAPPSNIYVQYRRITAAQFATAAATQALPLGSALPAGAEVLDVVMDVKVNWGNTTTALTAINVSVGTAGAVAGIRAAVNVYNAATTAVGRGYRGVRGVGVGGQAVQANFIGNTAMSNLANGMADFYIMYVMLPVVAP